MSIYVVPNAPRNSPKIGVINLDAFISEEHNYSSEVAEHPTEKGFPVSDNIVQQPTEITLDCAISPSPVQTQGTLPQRADKAYLDLRYYQKNGILVDIVTGLIKYRKMAITNVTIPRDKSNSKILRFTITLKQVRVSSSAKTTTETYVPTEEVITEGTSVSGVTVDGRFKADHTQVHIEGYGAQEQYEFVNLNPTDQTLQTTPVDGGTDLVTVPKEPTSNLEAVESAGKANENSLNFWKTILQ